MAASEKTITDILGSPDDMKFRSSMTLFDEVSHQEIFAEAIGAFYLEGKDPATLAILEGVRPGAPEMNWNPANPRLFLQLA
jgi:uncharacterized protein (DUF1810 family)